MKLSTLTFFVQETIADSSKAEMGTYYFEYGLHIIVKVRKSAY